MNARIASSVAAAEAEPAAGTGFWTLLLAVGLLALAGTTVRLVGGDEQAVVSRRGRVHRVVGPGVALRLPWVERLVTVAMGPVEMPLVVSASTRDGVSVRLMVTAVCEPIDPSAAVRHPAPLDATALTVEEELQEVVARRDLADLLPVDALAATMPAVTSARAAAWGTRVSRLEVQGVETRVTPYLLGMLRRPLIARESLK